MSQRTPFSGRKLSMASVKGIASIAVIAAICLAAAVIGIVSDKYLGDDNPVEHVSEEIIDEIAEKELNLPQGSVNIDLSPSSKKQDA